MNPDLSAIITQLRGIAPQQFRRGMSQGSYVSPVLLDNMTIHIQKTTGAPEQSSQPITYLLEVWQSDKLIAQYQGQTVNGICDGIDKKVRKYEDEQFYFEHGGGD